jgi:hypothetical protein
MSRLRVVEVPVICARCRETFKSISLTISRTKEEATVYGICDSCRTGLHAPSPNSRESNKPRGAARKSRTFVRR